MDYVGIAALVAAVAAAVVSIINAIRTPRAMMAVETKVDGVHNIVNSQRAGMLDEITALKQDLINRDKVAQSETVKLAVAEARKVLDDAATKAKAMIEESRAYAEKQRATDKAEHPEKYNET